MSLARGHSLKCYQCILVLTAPFKSAGIMNVNLAFSENRIKIPSCSISPNKSIVLKNQTTLSVLWFLLLPSQVVNKTEADCVMLWNIFVILHTQSAAKERSSSHFKHGCKQHGCWQLKAHFFPNIRHVVTTHSHRCTFVITSWIIEVLNIFIFYSGAKKKKERKKEFTSECGCDAEN